MTPSDIANKLASACQVELRQDTDSIRRTNDVILDVCCLKELFDIVESAERISFHNYCDGMLVDRIRTLKAKLKERNITL